jgi:hypothetical protein
VCSCVDEELISPLALGKEYRISDRRLASLCKLQPDMCPQDRSPSYRTLQTHEFCQPATPTSRPVLARKPKIACLASAVRFASTVPTVSARLEGQAVSQTTQTSPNCNTALCNQLTTPSPDTRPALAVSNNPTCQHRRTHAFVQGRWIPVCVRSSDPETQPTNTPPGRETALCDQLTTPSLHARPALVVGNDPTCRHRRSHAVVQGRLIPFCVRCGDPNEIDTSPASLPSSSTCAKKTIAVGARPVLQTMQGFPFDLRRSRVEAGRLME